MCKTHCSWVCDIVAYFLFIYLFLLMCPYICRLYRTTLAWLLWNPHGFMHAMKNRAWCLIRNMWLYRNNMVSILDIDAESKNCTFPIFCDRSCYCKDIIFIIYKLLFIAGLCCNYSNWSKWSVEEIFVMSCKDMKFNVLVESYCPEIPFSVSLGQLCKLAHCCVPNIWWNNPRIHCQFRFVEINITNVLAVG